ncbi:MAG: zinc D-Ala-D-Ala carboxypeptidase [Patescibacteria group bacterium]|nr:zinc D-Ala-D-Ala carboxypeptidase [Patescibacteria group bacterium]
MSKNTPKNKIINRIVNQSTALGALVILLVASLISNFYLYDSNQNTKKQNQTILLESQNLRTSLDDIGKKYENIAKQLDINEKDRLFLVQSFNQVGSEYNGLMNNYNEKLNEVTTLQKAVFIPDELLKKYSKYYFLNENYSPSSTVQISLNYTLNGKEVYIMPEVYTKLEKMILDAKNTGINLVINSGYRSFNEQKGLKSAYTQRYGSGANTFSADQGYSEHQLGTTVDITDGKVGLVTSFENTKASTWLRDNAYRYGFILSYPRGNNYYMYEPWHWRYVGVELATYLHDKGLNFYDLDQNVIDSYKTKIFD